jgi:hypothetical protein
VGMCAVVDVGVLMSASKLGAPEHYKASFALIRCLKQLGIALCVDTEGLIHQQYKDKLGGTSTASLWARAMAAEGFVVFHKRRHVSVTVREKLQKARFKFDEDYDLYVRTVIASPSGLLISNDPDYCAAACAALRKESVTVCTALEALGALGCPPIE